MTQFTISENQFNFDLERMKRSIESGTISFPRGMTHEQRRQHVLEQLKLHDEKALKAPSATHDTLQKQPS